MGEVRTQDEVVSYVEYRKMGLEREFKVFHRNFVANKLPLKI